MISINFDGLQTFEKSLEGFAEDVAKKGDKLCEELAELGREVADVRFRDAVYSGVNDVDVQAEKTDDGYYVIAEGTSVLFIEYGTGINTAPHTIPVYERGGYGQGKGKNKAWVYNGRQGNNGIPLGKGRVLTYGDPANECMYSAAEEMRDNVTRIAKEVFEK